MNSKYEINTKENREFLKASCEDLLNFGHRFPSPNGGSYYLGDDGTPWKDRNRGNLDHLPHGTCIQPGTDAWP